MTTTTIAEMTKEEERGLAYVLDLKEKLGLEPRRLQERSLYSLSVTTPDGDVRVVRFGRTYSAFLETYLQRFLSEEEQRIRRNLENLKKEDPGKEVELDYWL